MVLDKKNDFYDEYIIANFCDEKITKLKTQKIKTKNNKNAVECEINNCGEYILYGRNVDKKSISKFILGLIILLCIGIVLFGTYIEKNKKSNEDIPTAPVITGGNLEWEKESVIKIEKDSTNISGIDYYEYCINESEDFNNCEWKKTTTKNAIVSTSGKNYVVFRGVGNNGEKGILSNVAFVLIDNESPEIEGLNVKIIDSVLNVEIIGNDKHSGIDKFYYKINNQKYQLTNKLFKIEDYQNIEMITIKAIDKLGNYSELEVKINQEELINDGNTNQEENNNNNNNNNDDNNQEESSNNESNKENESGVNDNNITFKAPIINLNDLPEFFEIQEKYELPSYYLFDELDGEVICLLDDEEKITDTSKINIGKHKIECSAIGNNGLTTKVNKNIFVSYKTGEDEVLDGYIKMNLYFPENSTDWQWRLGNENEIRTGNNNDGWQDYIGPIVVKLTDVENIYIRYKINGKMVTVPPTGKVLVDIIPEKYTILENQSTNVTIKYDEYAETKLYRINNGGWTEYEGDFSVNANTLIEAKATKKEKVYDNDGNLITTRNITTTDSVFINAKEEVKNGEQSTISGGKIGENVEYEVIENTENYYTSIKRGSKPNTYLAGPNITQDTNDLVEETKVRVTPQEVADKIYISIDNGNWEEYTEEVTINKNCIIKAYYIRYIDGKRSDTSYYYVQNIYIRNSSDQSIIPSNMPYVKIDAEPTNYLSQTVDSVKVNITGKNYNKLEYSLDGAVYYSYEKPLEINHTTKVYARAINENGIKTESITITTEKLPEILDNLNVSINVTPEKNAFEGLINKVLITIDYDSNATEKYYTIGSYGTLTKYEGPFELKTNSVIYAYAINDKGYGSTKKQINYLTTGISEPIIEVLPDDVSDLKTVNINYSDNAIVKKYKIDNGPWLDYTESLSITENSTIYAYNEDALNNYSSSSKTIEIQKLPRYVLIDNGSYFMLKLNYPSSSSIESREYKWTPTGEWKKYDSIKGILLIKPENKDEILTSDGVKIEDNEGNEIIYTDHYYFVNVPMNELIQDLFMRWDTAKPSAPEFIPSTEEPAKELTIGINYDSTSVVKLYKVVTPSGVETDWIQYDKPIKITENGTVIYAKSQNSAEVYSNTKNYKVTNIDKEKPIVNVVWDSINPKREITIQINATDNIAIDKVGYAKGNKNEEYFTDNGTFIKNNGTFKVTENGIYTICAIDKVENIVIKTIEITNIDKNAPDIKINILTENMSNVVEFEIDYGDSTIKKYKIGRNSNYQDYTNKVTIKAENILNLANEDKTLTIFAKGIDAAGNEQEVNEIVYTIDLDAPKAPVINVSAGYPVLKEYGVSFDDVLSVSYDDRDDITNYISLDNGQTWKLYTGIEHVASGKVMAKSVKNNSGLTVLSEITIKQPSDAIGIKAYDGNTSTYEDLTWKSNNNYINPRKMYISKEMQGKYLNVNFYSQEKNNFFSFYDENGNLISKDSSRQSVIYIPKNTKYFITDKTGVSFYYIYEIKPSTTPRFLSKSFYPTITEYGIAPGYNEITIDYFQTSVKRLYKIDNGEWKEYKNKEVRVEIGKTLYAKGIDKYGKETEISKYTAILPSDAIGVKAYDDNTSTYEDLTWKTSNNYVNPKKMYVSKEMQGKYLNINFYSQYPSMYFNFYDEKGNFISQNSSRQNIIYIPENTKYFIIDKNRISFFYIYEIKPSTVPRLSKISIYPTLTENGITQGFDKVTINYFQTSVKKLYKIDNGEWKEYENKEINLEVGKTLYAKGIDKYGKETDISKHTAVLPTDALGQTAYDGNNSTYENLTWSASNSYVNPKKMYVSKEMQGGYLNISFYSQKKNNYFSFYDEKGKLISKDTSRKNNIYIPTNTKYFITDKTGISFYYIYEIKPLPIPTITQKSYYPTMSLSGFKDTYYEVNIGYFSYLNNKLYSIDNGLTWNNYEKKLILNPGTIVKAKAIQDNGSETGINSLTVTSLKNILDSKAYDKDFSTIATIATNSTQTFSLKEDTVGKDLRIYMSTTPASNATIKFYDSENNELKNVSLIGELSITRIPEGSVKVSISSGSSALNIPEINLREEIVDNNIELPNISIDNVDLALEKEISIVYPDGYKNEYSLDNGETWQEYTEGIIVNQNITIFARCLDENNNVVSSSSFVITKIGEDNSEAEENGSNEKENVAINFDKKKSSINNDKNLTTSFLNVETSDNSCQVIKEYYRIKIKRNEYL
ncbi:MAG: hypothetical protein ACI31M_03145 [Bacilli bacterium]